MTTPEDFTIPDKLDSINVTKQAIRQAIVDKGVEVPDGTTFYEYAGKIGEIETGGKKYKIEGVGAFPTQVQSSASAGDVVITAAGDGVVGYTVYELTEDGSREKTISIPYSSSSGASIDDLPQVVQDALANIPQTTAPPQARAGYSWFIMPPCDVYLQIY